MAGEREKRAGNGQQRVREVEGGGHRQGGECRPRHCSGIQKLKTGKRVLGESWGGGARGSRVNRPGSR